MKRFAIIILLIAIIIAGVVVGNVRREQTPDWEDMDIETQLRQGQLYGASRLLEEYGHRHVHNKLVLYGFADNSIKYANNSLLIIANTSNELDEKAADQLLEWVEQGNTVVIAQQNQNDFNQRLRERLNVNINHVRNNSDADNQPNIAVAPSCQQEEQRNTAQLQRINPKTATDPKYRNNRLQECSRNINTLWLPEGRKLAIHSDSNAQFSSKQNNWLASQKHNGNGSIIGLTHGSGRIVLSEELDFFANPRHPAYRTHALNSHDHAYLLVYLAQNRDSVYLVGTWKPQSDLLPPPTWLKLLRAQPVALLLLLATIIIGIWHLTSRTGPIRNLPPAPERSLNRHLLAQGRFFSQHFSRRAILQRLQQQLLEEWQARHPTWQTMNTEQRLQYLARQTQLPPSQIKAWLTPLPEQIGNLQWLQMLQSHRLMRRNSKKPY